MEKYMHYGIEVVRQVIDKTFISILNEAKCQYTELAINPEINVIKYIKDGETKYALIHPLDGSYDYAEAVYITSQTPDDCNWELLRTDIELQKEGQKPMERKTRLAMLIEDAEKYAYSITDKEEEDFNVFASAGPQIDEGRTIALMKTYLAAHGVIPSNLEKMEAYDVSESLMKKLKGKNYEKNSSH
ncbi:MAG: hypothetical protein ACLVAW_27650 [Eisenbergiella massiliensis]